ncbi:MAG: LacI family DNA-binding transcriptional regulator [Alphaproteobacteria bacterium]
MGRMTLSDIARTAGVSLATVDRVLNNRPGVRDDTATRVRAVVRSLDYRPDRSAARLARGERHRFCFVLPTGDNQFMEALATIALDHPAVRQAIDDLAAAGTDVVTLVSDTPEAARVHFVGIDNLAAGRTAASLLGRFTRGDGGKVGLIAGSLALRDHIERRMGFEQVMERDFPHLTVLPIREGRDESGRVQELANAIISDHDDLVGFYCVGAGVDGLVAALEAADQLEDVVLIAHELTAATRRHLLRGAIDAIINQDAGHEVRSAVRLLLAAREKTPVIPAQERIRIDVFIRENVPGAVMTPGQGG